MTKPWGGVLKTAKTAAMRINLNIDGCGVVAPPFHSSSRAPLLLANLLAHNLPHPHRPWLVVSFSTCPPFSPSPSARGFFIYKHVRAKPARRRAFGTGIMIHTRPVTGNSDSDHGMARASQRLGHDRVLRLDRRSQPEASNNLQSLILRLQR